MKPVIALPFTEMTVQVVEEPDPACLLRIRGKKYSVVGRKSLCGPLITIQTEDGWVRANPLVFPIVEVVERE